MGEGIAITSGDLSATIAPLGAELISLRDADGRELMTDADPAYWTGHAPLLFPIVGKLADDTLHVDGAVYPMKQHGFARKLPWQVTAHEPHRAVFTLTDSEETRAHYPFAFHLTVSYVLTGATLAVDIRITNPGDAPFPASFGFHPAFAWPLPYGKSRKDHRIVFETPEGAIRYLQDGLIASDTRPSPLDNRTLHLRDDLFVDDALIWDAVRSQSVRYGAPTGPQLAIAFPDTPFLGVWTKPGASFICIEPWHGLADPVGFAGDMREKPGVFAVAPGEIKTIGMSVTLHL